jgi:hypothetical protein
MGWLNTSLLGKCVWSSKTFKSELLCGQGNANDYLTACHRHWIFSLVSLADFPPFWQLWWCRLPRGTLPTILRGFYFQQAFIYCHLSITSLFRVDLKFIVVLVQLSLHLFAILLTVSFFYFMNLCLISLVDQSVWRSDSFWYREVPPETVPLISFTALQVSVPLQTLLQTG